MSTWLIRSSNYHCSLKGVIQSRSVCLNVFKKYFLYVFQPQVDSDIPNSCEDVGGELLLTPFGCGFFYRPYFSVVALSPLLSGPNAHIGTVAQVPTDAFCQGRRSSEVSEFARLNLNCDGVIVRRLSTFAPCQNQVGKIEDVFRCAVEEPGDFVSHSNERKYCLTACIGRLLPTLPVLVRTVLTQDWCLHSLIAHY